MIAFLASLVMASAAQGQNETLSRNNQFWFDYDPTWVLSKRWTLDVDVATRFINSDPPIWQIRLYPTLEFRLLKWMDLSGGVWFVYTNRFEKSDLFETRPFVGIKLKKDIWRGIRLSNYVRQEFRIRRDLDTGATLFARRLRDRLQVMIPINHKSLSEDNTWYAFADAEWFRQVNPEVNDGFNSRRRYRTGIAWRRNSTWTYQFFYGFQRSRNNVNQPSVVENIFSISLIHNIK
ncbi:MAG TPA: DUF2490 domain-containing protein [Blastocatellia bacterium]|nr:DUF2490 domain-containing protein [Blastocatellia bacterium]